MCTSPIRITNKTKGLKDGYTRHDMYVPCGMCDECRSTKADQWHLRILDTLREYKNAGGEAVFVTFTYDEDHLPKHYYIHKDGTERYFPCFSKLDKDKCIRKIQDYFRYHFNYDPKITGRDDLNIPTYDDMPVRFIWTSEYGLDYTRTQRSHYHVIFFIPPRIFKLFGYNELKWKRFFREMWCNGMTRYSPGRSIFVNSEFAGIYVSKYINKGIDFYNQRLVKEYFEQAIVDGEFDKDIFKQLMDEVRSKLPHHWQSPYFGAQLQRKYENLDSYINGVDFHLLSEIQKGRSKKHQCPQYIERRMLMNWDNSTKSYRLTDKGIEYRVKKFEKQVYDYAERYNELLDRRKLKFLLKDEDIFRTNKILRKYGNMDGLYNYITSILVKVSSSIELYLYNRVWSGCLTKHKDQVQRLDNLDYIGFLNSSIQQYSESLYLPFDDYVEEGYFVLHPPEDEDWYDLGSCNRFTGFSEAIKVFGEIYNVYNRRINAQYQSDYIHRKNNKFNLKTA